MEKILKVLFKDTQVLKGGYMRGPIHAPLILAIPLIIIYSLMALPFYPIVLIIDIIEKIKKKEWPDKWELLFYVIWSVAFLIWINFILR